MPRVKSAVELNTWVTIAPEKAGTKGKLAAQTPALVSRVGPGDTVCVIYPCELVLRMGFSGSPLKRIEDVLVGRVRPLRTKDDGSLKRIRELLTLAARKAAADAQQLRKPVPDMVELLPETMVQRWVGAYKTDLSTCVQDKKVACAVFGQHAKQEKTSTQPESSYCEKEQQENAERAVAAQNIANGDMSPAEELLPATTSEEASVASTPHRPRRRTASVGLDDCSRDSVEKEPMMRADRPRDRSRSRSCKRGIFKVGAAAESKPKPCPPKRGASEGLQQSTAAERRSLANELKYFTLRATAATFGQREEIPKADLLKALQGVCKEFSDGVVSPDFLLEQLDEWNRVLIVDDLVIRI